MNQHAIEQQIERILESETFRNCDALKRLLRFLADKTFSGEADQLKEYSVGIDALGKPPTYDPRRDSVVRIQVGRLRQKLQEYYGGEGKGDPVEIQLPKGRFKLNWRERAPDEIEGRNGQNGGDQSGAAPHEFRRRLTAKQTLGIALGLAIVWAALATVALWREKRTSSRLKAAWSDEMEELWHPLTNSGAPIVVAVSSPLFVGFTGQGLFRDLMLNQWAEVEKSHKIEALRRTLGGGVIFPRHNYTSIGTANAVFYLGKLLAVKDIRASLFRSSLLTWQQLADYNVILVGSFRVLAEQLRGLPVDLLIVGDSRGVRNLRPENGQPALLFDNYRSLVDEYSSSPLDPGELYAVITCAPGPLGSTTVLAFTSSYSIGTLGAVQAFTTPALAKELFEKLRKPSGELPRYYQIVLKVKYKEEVPNEVAYVLHHELTPRRLSEGR